MSRIYYDPAAKAKSYAQQARAATSNSLRPCYISLNDDQTSDSDTEEEVKQYCVSNVTVEKTTLKTTHVVSQVPGVPLPPPRPHPMTTTQIAALALPDLAIPLKSLTEPSKVELTPPRFVYTTAMTRPSWACPENMPRLPPLPDSEEDEDENDECQAEQAEQDLGVQNMSISEEEWDSTDGSVTPLQHFDGSFHKWMYELPEPDFQIDQSRFHLNPLFGMPDCYSDLPDLIDASDDDEYCCVSSDEWDDDCCEGESLACAIAEAEASYAEESYGSTSASVSFSFPAAPALSAKAHEFETHIEALLRDMWRDADQQSERGFNFSAPEFHDFPPLSVLVKEQSWPKSGCEVCSGRVPNGICGNACAGDDRQWQPLVWPAFPIEWGQKEAPLPVFEDYVVPEFPSNYAWPETPEFPPVFEFGVPEEGVIDLGAATEHEISTYDLLIAKLEEGLLRERPVAVVPAAAAQTIDDAIAICDEMLGDLITPGNYHIITECDAVLSQIPPRLAMLRREMKQKTD